MRAMKPIRSELDLYEAVRKGKLITIAYEPRPKPERIDDPDDWIMVRLGDTQHIQWDLSIRWTTEQTDFANALELNAPFFYATHFVVTSLPVIDPLVQLSDLIVRTDTIRGREYVLDKPGMTLYCVPFHRHQRFLQHVPDRTDLCQDPIFARIELSHLIDLLPPDSQRIVVI